MLLEKGYIIYSRDGYWNNDVGWGDIDSATVFTKAESLFCFLPISSNNDAKWVKYESERNTTNTKKD